MKVVALALWVTAAAPPALLTSPPLVEAPPSPPTAAPAPRPGWIAVEARLGLALLQEASGLRSTAPAPGLRGACWLGRFAEIDGGYQFAYDEQGTNGVHATNTLHAFDVRLHALFPLRWAQLSAGLGLAGYLETVQLAAVGSSEPTRTTWTWGLPVAFGIETWVQRWPVRFETQLATRGDRVDLLFATAVGWSLGG